MLSIFLSRVGEWTIEVMKKARTDIFEPEVRPPAISLTPSNKHTHTHTHMQYLQDEAMGRNAQTCGLSWVKPGTYKPFSKDDT